MSVGVGVVSDIGAGTLQASTSASTIAAVPGASQGNLVVLLAYVTGQDCTLAKDAGDGWLVLDSVYDTANAFGALIAACIAPRTTHTYAGLTLPGAAGYTAQTYTFSRGTPNAATFAAPYKLDLGAATGSRAGITGAASSATFSVPGISPSYGQWLDICGGGYNNAGTTTTIGVVTDFSEKFDTGQTSPPHGVWLDAKSANQQPTQSGQSVAATSATLAVAKTNRAGLRICIPCVGNVNASAFRRRYMSARRAG